MLNQWTWKIIQRAPGTNTFSGQEIIKKNALHQWTWKIIQQAPIHSVDKNDLVDVKIACLRQKISGHHR